MLTDRLAVTAPADVPYSGNDLLYLALQQQAPLLGAPAGTGFRVPVFAQCRDLAEVVYRMIKVKELMHLLHG